MSSRHCSEHTFILLPTPRNQGAAGRAHDLNSDADCVHLLEVRRHVLTSTGTHSGRSDFEPRRLRMEVSCCPRRPGILFQLCEKLWKRRNIFYSHHAENWTKQYNWLVSFLTSFAASLQGISGEHLSALFVSTHHVLFNLTFARHSLIHRWKYDGTPAARDAQDALPCGLL